MTDAQTAAAIFASNPTPAEIWAADIINRQIHKAPLWVQDIEFLHGVKTVERKAS
jgi:hypothetical protein